MLRTHSGSAAQKRYYNSVALSRSLYLREALDNEPVRKAPCTKQEVIDVLRIAAGHFDTEALTESESESPNKPRGTGNQ